MHESASSQICICGESPTFVTARGTLRRAGHFCEIQILFGARTRALSFAAPNLVFSLVLRPPPPDIEFEVAKIWYKSRM